jgi:hypothetical protein
MSEERRLPFNRQAVLLMDGRKMLRVFLHKKAASEKKKQCVRSARHGRKNLQD